MQITTRIVTSFHGDRYDLSRVDDGCGRSSGRMHPLASGGARTTLSCRLASKKEMHLAHNETYRHSEIMHRRMEIPHTYYEIARILAARLFIAGSRNAY